MVKLNKISTRTGDDGTTGLVDGSRIAKSAPLMAAMVERGDIGAKAGRGFYDWPPERRERVQADKARALAELAAWLQRREQDAA